MRRFLVVLLMVSFIASSAARADEASKRAKAEELFTLLRMDQTMGAITANIMKQVQTMTQSMPGADQATPEQKKLVVDFQQRVMDLVDKRLGWKALEPDFIGLYASTYTDEELDGIIAFYKSPIGQKMLEKTPELMSKSSEITQQKMREIQPEFNQMIQDFMKQMAATTAKPAPADSTPNKSTAPSKPQP